MNALLRTFFSIVGLMCVIQLLKMMQSVENQPFPTAPIAMQQEEGSSVKSPKGNTVIIKGASGYVCILPPTQTNTQYFAVGENIYLGSSEMLPFICEYLKRRNLVKEIIPKSRRLMKRLIYESHLLEMTGLRDATMQKYVNSRIKISEYNKGVKFVIRKQTIRNGIINYYNKKSPSVLNSLDTKIKAAMFNVNNNDGMSSLALSVFIVFTDNSVLKDVSREIVEVLPKFLSDIGKSSEIADLMKRKLSETLFYQLKQYANQFGFLNSYHFRINSIIDFIHQNNKLFMNYENCFTNFSKRPMIGCIAIIKELTSSQHHQPLVSEFIQMAFDTSDTRSFLGVQYKELKPEFKEKVRKLLLSRLNRALRSI